MSTMNKPDKSQKIKIHQPTSSRSPLEMAERVERAYEKLVAFLNRLGYYPKSREEAKKLARDLLDQGWEE